VNRWRIICKKARRVHPTRFPKYSWGPQSSTDAFVPKNLTHSTVIMEAPPLRMGWGGGNQSKFTLTNSGLRLSITLGALLLFLNESDNGEQWERALPPLNAKSRTHYFTFKKYRFPLKFASFFKIRKV